MFDFFAFLRKQWSEKSAASGQKGTVIDELAVKPTGLIMADFYNTLVDERRTNNISQWKDMTDEQLDFFGNKFFTPRVEGDHAVGEIKIWFDRKKNIEITENFRAVSANGGTYRAAVPGFISGSSFTVSDDNYGHYYISVPIIATYKGTVYNADAGEITRIDNINFEYKFVTNQESIQHGSKHETNEEYYNRLIYAINDRSLLSKKSMMVKLPEFFPIINSMHIAGPGDRYMNRDLVSGLDISTPVQKLNYLGKTNGENLVKHIAFYGIFPPEPGSFQKEAWGPFSVYTEFPYPLTIEATDLTSSITYSGQDGDPAYHGYPITQEMTNDMYKNLFFDDYKNSVEISTVDLFNIEDENVGFEDVITPSPDWVYGASGYKSGDFGGSLYVGDSYTTGAIDVMKFNNNEITLSGGAGKPISLSKDIQKRTGVKLTGTLVFPEFTEFTDENVSKTKDSNLQIMVGGANSDYVDGFTGVGFGVRMVSDYETGDYETLENNTVIYIAHNENYGETTVYAADSDFFDGIDNGHIGITDFGALAETMWRIQPGVEYEFEFIIHDDLRVTLYINKLTDIIDPDDDNKDTTFNFSIKSSVLKGVYGQELLKADTDHYGTMMKVTLDTPSLSRDDQWVIGDLKAFDMQLSKPNSLYAFDVSKIDDPVSLYLRAFGSSLVDNGQADGYSAYIWDKEVQSIATGSTELSRGGWTYLDGISNPNGSKDVLTAMLSHRIENLERYSVDSRFGKNVFILITTTGTSFASSKFSGNVNSDINAQLTVDYIEMRSDSLNYYHANNKADVYLSTLKNTEELDVNTVILTKTGNQTYFEMSEYNDCKMPINEIISVTIGAITDESEELSETEYQIVYPDASYTRSSQETVRIILDNYTSNQITVEYTTYPEVSRVQEYFDGKEFGKIYGDVLVKHKNPVELTFDVKFLGNITEDELILRIKEYIDDNIDGVFSVQSMVDYLYTEVLVNNVQRPITVSYSRHDDEGRLVTGTFTETLEITDIEFFRAVDISVSRM